MNIKEIKEIINLMNENHLTEIEVEKEGLKLRLKKGPGGEIVMESAPPVRVAASPAPVLPPTAPAAAPAEAPAGSGKKTVEVKAPMVGTFYRAPSPESPAFVEINQNIEVGQVVCILEAMKLMNEIKTDIKGRVVDILVDNAEPVEFGQPLFLIEPA